MKRKDILELRKRLTKDKCSFTRVCGCFVNSEKNIILDLKETFLNLDEDDYFRYLEIAKKVLSGAIGNKILELDFPTNQGEPNDKQLSLINLKKSKLKDDDLLDSFYQNIIDNYDYNENYLILVFHDVYDIVSKTTDNLKLDESEEVYEYVLCAICPVSLSTPKLSYYENENAIKSQLRDWVVDAPLNGFVYPAFIDRSPDVNSMIYYTKKPKEPHPELMEDALGCSSKETSTIQKEKFELIIKDAIGPDEEEADDVYMEVQDSLNTLVEEHKSISDSEDDPIQLTKDDLQNLLVDSKIPQENTSKIENWYEQEFINDFPLAESLIDSKTLKANEQRKKEKVLEEQIAFLSAKLEEANIEEESHEEYDIIIKVKAEKSDEIKSQKIDGQEYILIPNNEKVKIQ